MDFPGQEHETERLQLYPPVHFEHLTDKALRAAERVPPQVASLLRLLLDCRPVARLGPEQERGASYASLDRIAESAGIHGDGRVTWFEVAETIPLTERHAAHMLHKLGEGRR